MTDRNHELDQLLQATIGLGASASATALRNVSDMHREVETSAILDQIAILSSLSERAETCLTVAAYAEAENNSPLAEQGCLQALTLMNHMAEISTGLEPSEDLDGQFTSFAVAMS